ncbi:hypothetical protein ABW20_dc0102023 [Dactylellina cionopaga]|nr:hypothetical protein ABW20_dc0102023 [Dactylellina cionopaga]
MEPTSTQHTDPSSTVRTFYPHPFSYQSSLAGLTYREEYLRNFSTTVRNKTSWTAKVLDRGTVAKWLDEAQEADNAHYGQWWLAWNRVDVEFVYKELLVYRKYVEELKKQGLAVEPDIDGVWRADELIEKKLRKQLIEAAATLENVPAIEKNWRPDSDNQILDLIDPWLWPIVYNGSFTYTNGKKIEPPGSVTHLLLNNSPEGLLRMRYGYSATGCWLPSEFQVSSDGKETKIMSYINGLPSSSSKQQDLFHPIVSKIFTKFVPLFNHVLADLDRETHSRTRFTLERDLETYKDGNIFISKKVYRKEWEKLLGQFKRGKEMTVDFDHFGKKLCWDHEKCKGRSRFGLRKIAQTSSACDKYDGEKDEVYVLAMIINPRVEMRDSWSPPVLSEERRLEGKTVKVIVKMFNIELTPDKPKYNGEDLHVEGMLDERIVATGVYFYAQKNVTESGLAFKRTFDDLHVHEPVRTHHAFDTPLQGNAIQDIGKITAKDNRAVVFPNFYPYQMESFELVNKAKRGYRKMLVFCLCDPSKAHALPTTRVVASQQPKDSIQLLLRQGVLGNRFPEEVFQLILDAYGLPPVMTKEEAEEYKKTLLSERTAYNQSSRVQGSNYYCDR